ncbi:MAG: hypothetical protein LBL90_07980 [Prevotellaceae bacterium]|jgi:hypothetical protein|nr:hypothetical protein [Prevotellaceae bacterium]
MKKLTTFILAILIALSFVSCSSMESDAKKAAKQSYKIQQNYNGKWSVSASEEKEITAFQNKMLKKYGKDRETLKKFNQLVDKELKKLNAKK